MKTILLLTLLIGAPAQAPRTSPADYVVGPQDLLMITVVGEADLTNRFRVGSDGHLDFPLIGRVKVEGLTLRAVEDTLARRLTDGKFLVRPQVTIEVQEFRSQSVYVWGQVNLPGEYPLTGSMTLMDVFSKAVLKPDSAEDILIYRRKGPSEAIGPVRPGTHQDVEVIRVKKTDIQTGRASRSMTLRNGDTIIVSKTASISVIGQVNNPGSYPMDGELTVLQAIALAGGPTEKAATGRVTILRMVDGQQKKIRVRTTDLVQPGDTIEVPARWF